MNKRDSTDKARQYAERGGGREREHADRLLRNRTIMTRVCVPISQDIIISKS